MRSACAACRLGSSADPGAAELVDRLRERTPPLSGIFSIDKPAGMTSHDVVQRVRRASGEQRVGHAGTLDPMATGVLLVCVGKATRVTEYLMEHAKRYRAEITLGVTTDTLDTQGETIATADAGHISRDEVETALGAFRGKIEQIPPMYSAVKRQGKKLYELAREGITVEREARTVEITRLEIIAWEPPRVTIDVECSKGTYIRALARDLGAALGVGGHLSRLIRTASGRFTVAEASALDTVIAALEDDWWMMLIHPLDEALLDYEAIIVDTPTAVRISHGQMVEAAAPVSTAYARAYTADGRFIALLRYDPWAELWQPAKVFAQLD
jgi:tRNA pseudouridine55 synthase